MLTARSACLTLQSDGRCITRPSALDLLDKRYARGDINTEQYRHMRSD